MDAFAEIIEKIAKIRYNYIQKMIFGKDDIGGHIKMIIKYTLGVNR